MIKPLRPTLLLLALAFALAACGPSPKVAIVGRWDITVQGAGGMRGELVKLKADVTADGRYTLTGGPEFQAQTGTAETRGTYDFTDDMALMVTMDGEPMGYKPTDYKIEKVGRNELLLLTADYTVTMRRAD